ncbi:MAG TPA: large conductance mechanosensitive channel protein MscL [Longimicrobiales bacterium]|nr:large conductance mechanosensitive channel protein MscL [Trueperaceae bacterium]HKJ91545.1 large conductance mechanosensitive channel protein MscL [Longimicrobiales bacterium]
MLKEFRDFVSRGNVLDLAVAVVIGAAFGAITASLVNQVIMPVVGVLVGGVDFSNLGVVLKGAGSYTSVKEAVAAGAPVIQYGAFLNTLVNFLIIAWVLFMVVRGVNAMRRRVERPEPIAIETPPAVPAEERLLTEIRDLLASQGGMRSA